MSEGVKRLLLSLVVGSVLGTWVPLYSVYLLRDDINFGTHGFFVTSAVVTLLLAIFIFLLSSSLVLIGLRRLSSGVLYFLLFWLCLSGFIFPLVGRGGMISPEKLPADYFNLGFVAFGSLLLTLLTFTKLKSAAQAFALIVGITSMFGAFPMLYQTGASLDKFSTLSSTSNVIVLSLDGLSGAVARDVIEHDPELRSVFEDFVVYDNVISVAPATIESIRSEVYGNLDFRSLAKDSDGIGAHLSGHQNSLRREQASASDVMTYGAYNSVNDFPRDKLIPQTVAPSSAPERLAVILSFYPYVVARVGGPLSAGVAQDTLYEAKRRFMQGPMTARVLDHKGASWDASNTLQNEDLAAITQHLHTSTKPRVVRYMHFVHTHFPVDFDETCVYRSNDEVWFQKNQNYRGLFNETHCALRQATDFILKLKSIEAYADTLLVIKSDHGAPVSYFDHQPDSDTINGHSMWGYNRYRPFLMIKPERAQGDKLSHVNDLVSLSDLAKTLCIQAQGGNTACDDYDGINLLGPNAPNSSPFLYVNVVKDASSTFEFSTLKTVKVARQNDFLLGLQHAGGVEIRDSGNGLFMQRQRDLQAIRSALDHYHQVTGSYPVSQGFDGLHTDWGRSGQDWISGLTPGYLNALPRDPALSDTTTPQYLYKSDGKNYKLVANGDVGACAMATNIDPTMVDPVRDCWAFGYWSDGARSW